MNIRPPHGAGGGLSAAIFLIFSAVMLPSSTGCAAEPP
ncbi:hypothetical protein LCGC14_2090830, partial [marine sediment metagenome]